MNPLVLVVDDEPDVEVLFRQQFRRDLRSDRFTMEFAQSAPMALSAAMFVLRRARQPIRRLPMRADHLPAKSPSKLLADAKTESVRRRYQENIKEALEIDAFGSPCYELDGEVFWGQDRVELLDDALTFGRKAYRNDI